MYTIGLDIGGTSIKGGLVDSGGHLLRAASRATDVGNIDHLIAVLHGLVVELGEGEAIHAVGLGIPGLRSAETGEIVTSPNIPCLEGTQPEALLGEQVSPPVIARNDADMSAWGEFAAGAGVGARYLICLTLGTGVGSGVILDGELYNGARGYASEAGHLTVDPDGPLCSCGNRGCLEAVASAHGIVALARARMGAGEGIPEPWTAACLAQAAHDGHAGASEVFEQAGRYLGIACAGLINLLNPDAIVLAGGVMGAGDLLLTPTRREAGLRAFAASFSACRIVPADLGHQAGIVGSALFARHATV